MDDEKENTNLFPEVQANSVGHMVSAARQSRLKDVDFTYRAQSSLKSWRSTTSARKHSDISLPVLVDDVETKSYTSNSRDVPHLAVEYPPDYTNRRGRTSVQSAWSASSAASLKRNKIPSTVWKRDSLFSFGPSQVPKARASISGDRLDGGSVFGHSDHDLLIQPKERVGVVEFSRKFLLDASGHGLARIVENNISIIRRIVWSVFVVAALVMLIVQTRTILSSYLDFNFKVDVKYNFNKEIGFPAVTFCNLNPLNRTKLVCSRFDRERDDPLGLCQRSNVSSTDAQTIVQIRLQALLKSVSQFSFDYAFQHNFTQEYLTADEYNRYGFDLERMIVSCSFRGKTCSLSNFTKFQNPRFGNCYTFNNNASVQLQTSQPGPAFGLSLDLYLDPDEEVGLLAPGTGLRVSLHQPNVKSFPEEDGFSVAPGKATSIGVRQVQLERLGKPYSNCTNITSTNWQPLFPGYKYSRTTCLRGCLAEEMLRACKCVDEDFLVGERICSPSHINAGEARCVKKVRNAYQQNLINCDRCTNPCRDKVYRTTLSTATWPSTEYQREFKKLLKSRDLPVENVPADLFREKYVRLQVFYEELNFENIIQKPAYETENLLADIGGQFGLWIGLSVLAFLEFFEYLSYITLVLLGKVSLPVEEDFLKSPDEKFNPHAKEDREE